MKKIVLSAIVLSVFAFQFCTSSKKTASAPKMHAITYEGNIAPLLSANCSPCHFPPKGNKEPLNSYAAAKSNIDETLERIQKNPGERGFMPAKHPKLSDSTINVFKQWKNDGLLEK